jgi:hypothetical protein
MENTMSNNKSGFEIRANLLTQAQTILENNLQRTQDRVGYNNVLVESEHRTPLEVREVSPQEIIELAQTLYAFVESKESA